MKSAGSTPSNVMKLVWTGKAVSKNRMHVVHPHQNSRRIIQTTEYRTYLESMSTSWLRFRPKWPIDEPFDVMIEVIVGPRMDPQNVVDPVLDALEKAMIVTNDRWVRNLLLRKIGVHKQGDDDVIGVVVSTAPLFVPQGKGAGGTA